MSLAVDIFAWTALILGSFFCLTGALGLLRFCPNLSLALSWACRDGDVLS